MRRPSRRVSHLGRTVAATANPYHDRVPDREGSLRGAHALVPLVIAIPALVAVVVTLVHILSTRYPDLGYTQTLANDGKALANGASLYADPGQRYTGMLYGPLLPVVLA